MYAYKYKLCCILDFHEILLFVLYKYNSFDKYKNFLCVLICITDNS